MRKTQHAADAGGRQWPADKVHRRKVSALVPYARNARTHSDAQVDQIARSIETFGFTIPVLVADDGTIIAGHGRVLAAKRLGLSHVPVMVARGWTDEQRRAYVIADNRIAENSEWDDDLLRLELGDLRALDFDMGLIGFTSREITQILDRHVGRTSAEDWSAPGAAAPPTTPVTVAGDVWVLGRHRLVCGDATDAAALDAAINGKRLAAALLDPPYGIGEEYNAYDDTSENLDALIAAFLPMVRARAPVVLVTPGVGNLWRYPKPDWCLSWTHPAGAGAGPWGFTCWQPILAYGRDPYLASGKGRRPDSLVQSENADPQRHPCPKPIGVWKWLMDRCDPTDDGVVLDCFMGSGATISAAQQTGRTAVGTEIDPAYCDVIVERWQRETGLRAATDKGKAL